MSFPVPGIVASAGGGGGEVPDLPIALGGSLATYTSAGTSTSHTMAVTVPAAGANRKLVILAATSVSGNTTHTMTYNGVAMTAGPTGATFTNERISMWYMDDADLPDDGASHNAVLTTVASCSALMGCAGMYVNVAQGAPSGTGTDNDTGGALLSTALTGVSEGALVVDGAVSGNNTRFTPGASQEERFDFGGTVHSIGLAGSDVVGATAGTVTMTQDIDAGAPDADHVAAWWAQA